MSSTALRSSIILVFIGIVCGGLATAAPSQTGSIKGSVSICGQFERGVLIAVPGTEASAKTDRRGNFMVKGVPPGTYNVVVSRSNVTSGAINGVQVTAKMTTDVGRQALCDDADQDGYSVPSDCNDADPSINPGASEICNGVDDNCDGKVDENVSLLTWYRDQDGDRWGDARSTYSACLQPSGFVSASRDCNDNDPRMNPGQAEFCDGKDNDCDGTVDEEVADCNDQIACTVDICDGTNGCRFMPDDNLCDDQDPNTQDVCSPSDGGCIHIPVDSGATSCVSDNECISGYPGYYCDAATNTCIQYTMDGDSCSVSGECASGNCIDGVCCDVACAGNCMSCRGAFTGAADGTCAFVAQGTDPEDECSINLVCDGSGMCTVP